MVPPMEMVYPVKELLRGKILQLRGLLRAKMVAAGRKL